MSLKFTNVSSQYPIGSELSKRISACLHESVLSTSDGLLDHLVTEQQVMDVQLFGGADMEKYDRRHKEVEEFIGDYLRKQDIPHDVSGVSENLHLLGVYIGHDSQAHLPRIIICPERILALAHRLQPKQGSALRLYPELTASIIAHEVSHGRMDSESIVYEQYGKNSTGRHQRWHSSQRECVRCRFGSARRELWDLALDSSSGSAWNGRMAYAIYEIIEESLATAIQLRMRYSTESIRDISSFIEGAPPQ